jgi:Photosynthetic reaction centre cytochrome C subunit
MRLALTTFLAAMLAAAGTGTSRSIATTSAAADTVADARNRMARALLDSLGPRASMRADSVWPDLKTSLRNLPASRLIAVMNQGYGRSLGVTCTFCHVPNQYDREDSTWKQVARDMAAMAVRINQELLPAVPNLKGANPVVNCTTCHRGQVKPATNLDEAGTK